MTVETMAWTAALIVLYTWLFDLIDIQPQVGSFAFLRTFTYLVFVLLRIILGFVAALILLALEPQLSPAILALVAVLANVTVLQSLSLKVGGEQIAQLAPLFQNYKDKMVKEEQVRRIRRQDAGVLRVVEHLVSAPVGYLEVVLREMLIQAKWKMEDANKRIEEHQRAAEASTGAGQSINYLASSYAVDIAEMNLEHAIWIVDAQPWKKMISEK